MKSSQHPGQRSNNPHRRKKTQFEIFKETYLPIVIGCIALLLILIFVIGSITRAIQNYQVNKQLAYEESVSEMEQQKELDQEAASCINRAAKLAASYDYDSAILVLEGFSGEMTDYPEMKKDYDSYTAAKSEMVLWDDPASVLNLSFQSLMADPSRCYNDPNFGNSYNRNFVTVEEFQKILNQLYDNNYILIRLDDVTNGTDTFELYLPEGKKPLIITQTNVNYYRYMVDSNDDWIPDKDGAGFASKLIINENNNILCEMVDSQGNTTSGYYDLVPILESFITTHPDFSYRGARAILAVTGYDGIFGYRTNPKAADKLGSEQYQKEIDDAEKIVTHLRELGYEFACYTYENEPYGGYSAQQISDEMHKWNDEVTPILGKTNIFVFSRNSDIANIGMAYTDDRAKVLKDNGFNCFLGFCESDLAWFVSGGDHIRMGRILVSGTAMAHTPEFFTGMFDATAILDTNRGNVPS